MHIAQTSTMKCSLEQCFFSYAALIYEQHVSVFFFFFVVFIVSDFSRRSRIFLMRRPLSCEVPSRRDSVGGGVVAEFFRGLQSRRDSMGGGVVAEFAIQKCWSDFTRFIVSALKFNVSTFINPIFYLYRSRISNQLVCYDFTLFIVSITTLCYVYICLGVLYGDLLYSLT